MKIEVLRDKISNLISKTEKVSGKNPNLPILSCLSLEVIGNDLYIRATNMDLGLEIKTQIKGFENGSVVVPAQIINNYLNNLINEKTIKLETEGNLLKIKTEKTESSINTFQNDDFPPIPKINEGKEFKIKSKDLTNGIKSVIYSASNSQIKPELSSVYIHTKEENLIFTSTDSFRLAEKQTKTKKQIDIQGVLIPAKNAQDIVKILEDIDEEVSLLVSKNQISITFDGFYIVSRAIDGVFPDYKQIIPKEENTKATFLKQDIINSLKISNIFSDSFNQVNIKVDKKSGIVEIKTKNSNIGENTNKINAKIVGEDISVNFNSKYIVDCLQYITSDSVDFIFNGTNKPLVIKGSSNNEFLYLVMPMNR